MNFSTIEAVIVAVIVLIPATFGWKAYNNSQRSTIEIKKDDWECVKSEQRTYLQPMGTGFVLPGVNTVCVEYRRHAG